MKKLILLLVAIITVSCNESKQTPCKLKETVGTALVNDECLVKEISFGLHKIKINDSTTILFYRGSESCAMIQLK